MHHNSAAADVTAVDGWQLGKGAWNSLTCLGSVQILLPSATLSLPASLMDKHDAILGVEGEGDGVDLDVSGIQCLVLDVEEGVRGPPSTVSEKFRTFPKPFSEKFRTFPKLSLRTCISSL